MALIAAGLLTGCAGNGPNTQQGAVTGGAVGALVGGIIGNNSGHQTWEGAAIGAVAGAIAGGTLGNSIDNQKGTVYRSPEEAATNVVVQQIPAPPPPRGTEAIESAAFACSRLDSGLLGLQRRWLRLDRRLLGDTTAQLPHLRRSLLGPAGARIRVYPGLLALGSCGTLSAGS